MKKLKTIITKSQNIINQLENILLELNEEFKSDLIWDGQFREQTS